MWFFVNELSFGHSCRGFSASAAKVQDHRVVLGRKVSMELVKVFEGFPVQVGVDLIHFGKVLASNFVVVRVAVQPTVFKLQKISNYYWEMANK